MSGIGHHLVRRAFDATQEHFNSQGGFRGINPADEPQGQDEARIKQIAMWGIALIYLTGILYMALMSAVSNSQQRLSHPNPARLTVVFRSRIPMAMSLQLLL